MFDLTGRVALVTASSRGIGFAIAQAMAARGASVVISSRDAEACEAAAETIAQAGGDAPTPPSGVIAPSQRAPVRVIRYRLPENTTIPTRNSHPELLTHEPGQRVAAQPTASSASA